MRSKTLHPQLYVSQPGKLIPIRPRDRPTSVRLDPDDCIVAQTYDVTLSANCYLIHERSPHLE